LSNFAVACRIKKVKFEVDDQSDGTGHIKRNIRSYSGDGYCNSSVLNFVPDATEWNILTNILNSTFSSELITKGPPQADPWYNLLFLR